jgi:hypothetical protein
VRTRARGERESVCCHRFHSRGNHPRDVSTMKGRKYGTHVAEFYVTTNVKQWTKCKLAVSKLSQKSRNLVSSLCAINVKLLYYLSIYLGIVYLSRF